MKDVVLGVSKGCKDAGCALLGGETAEMPGLYVNKDFDLAGFAVGIVDRKKIIDGSSIKDGDVIIGISSSGLCRNIFWQNSRYIIIKTAASNMHHTFE